MTGYRSADGEFGNGVNDGLLLIHRELRVDRNREALVRGALGRRKISATIAQILETGLQVERHRIVNLVANLFAIEMRFQAVAIGHADHKLIEDMAPSGRFNRD